MTIKVSLDGGAELIAALGNMSDDIEREVSQIVAATAMEIQRDAKRRIQRGPKTGIVYQKYNPRRTHTASSPGQAPATDTGRLVNSIVFDVADKLSAVVSSKLRYARDLEFGTRRIAPRPFLTPSVEAMRPKFIGRLKRVIEGEIR